MKPLRAFIARLPFLEQLTRPIVIGLLASVVCLMLFAAIADEVREGDTESLVMFDIAVANDLHARATPFSTAFYRVLSFIGQPGIWAVGLTGGVVYTVRKQWIRLGLWSAALLGGLILNNVLKALFARPRPSFADPLAVAQNYSFPSGHAMMSLIGFGLVGYLIWKHLHSRPARILLVFAISLLISLIGISRLALGVHYFSDVIAGFAAGGIWLTACVAAMRRLDRRSALMRVDMYA